MVYLKKYGYFENRDEENMIQEFRLKTIDETRNYFLEEIEQNELMSRKHRKVCATLNYIEYILIFACTIAVCISTFALAFCLAFL